MIRKVDKEMISAIASGRSLDEQETWIQKYGNHGTPSLLRAMVLGSHGFARYKNHAENVVIFGCYTPFATPAYIGSYLQIFDLLGIDYCCLEEESCCGDPALIQCDREDREKVMDMSRSFNQINIDHARRKGAAKIAYFCVGCVHTTKALFPEEDRSHVYVHDLVMEKLETRPLRVSPTTIGYFEGCHTLTGNLFPGVKLDWQRYRRLLDRIEGLEVIDLPNNTCCKTALDQIFKNAEKRSIDRIVCACNGCYNFIGSASGGRMEIISFPELLLEAL